MFRLFCLNQDIKKDKIIITNPDSLHHFKNVLRAKAGEEAVVCDENAKEYLTIIEEFSAKSIVLKIKSILPAKPTRIKLTVACAIPKKSKFDDIVDKLIQVGVDQIIPLETERTIVRLNQANARPKLERWRKIALSASQQSQRNVLVKVEDLQKISELIKNSKEYDLKLIPTLENPRKTLKEVLNNAKFSRILVLIGPEGDFTPNEIATAISASFIPISLGDTVLRVETAAVVAASFIRLYAND